MKSVLVPLAVGVVVLGAGWWYLSQKNEISARGGQEQTPQNTQEAPSQARQEQQTGPSATGGADNLVEFACADSKKITAVFTRDIVGLTLSDGRQVELRMTTDGDGYQNVNGTIQFRRAGAAEGELVEGGTVTFSSCVAR